jgi:hypothetical protein
MTVRDSSLREPFNPHAIASEFYDLDISDTNKLRNNILEGLTSRSPVFSVFVSFLFLKTKINK